MFGTFGCFRSVSWFEVNFSFLSVLFCSFLKKRKDAVGILLEINYRGFFLLLFLKMKNAPAIKRMGISWIK